MEENKLISDLSKNDLDTVFELLPVPSYLYKLIDNELILIKFNRAAINITEGIISEYLGLPYHKIHKLNPDIIDDFSKCLKKKENISRTMEFTYNKLGKTRILEVNYRYIPEDMVLVQTRDITKEKLTKKKLRASEEKLKIMIESLPFDILMLDRNETYVMQNSLSLKNWGNILGKKPEDVTEDRATLKLWKKNNRRAFSGEILRNDVSFKVEGETRFFHNIIAPIYLENQVVYIIVVNIDITERKRTEERIKQSEMKYRKAFNKAEFYKDVLAHDINNILQSILLSAELIEFQAKEQIKGVNIALNISRIEDQVYRGAELIENINKLSDLEGKEVKIINLCECLKDVLNTIRASYENVNIKVKTHESRIEVKANDLIVDVFENLIKNAVTHNQKEHKEIIIKLFKIVKNEKEFIRMEFIDNARGIEDKRKSNIFERFKKQKFGMGLGLSLVKQIVDSYDGEIWVEDRVKGFPSRGSNFTLLIPTIGNKADSIKG